MKKSNRTAVLGSASVLLVVEMLAPGLAANASTDTDYRSSASLAADDAMEPEIRRILAWKHTVKGWSTSYIESFTCPSDVPYLYKEQLAPRRSVPTGVEVYETGGFGVGVTIHPYDWTVTDHRDGYAHGGYLNGWTKGDFTSATNWIPADSTVHIYANCTDDPALGYNP